jgi:hypothetical protein
VEDPLPLAKEEDDERVVEVPPPLEDEERVVEDPPPLEDELELRKDPPPMRPPDMAASAGFMQASSTSSMAVAIAGR